MDLSRDPFQSTIYGDIKPAIEILMERRYFASALIVLFSAMDILANLDRPEGKEESRSEDFETWVERFLIPELPYKITRTEIWSARCAILHAMGADSRRTRSGEARRISFTIGGGRDIIFNPKIDPTFVFLRLETLVGAFYKAIDRYYVAAYSDANKARIVEERLGQMFMSIPHVPEDPSKKS